MENKVRELVCSKFAKSKGMRENNCSSIDGILPCAYKAECSAFLAQIKKEMMECVPEKKDCPAIYQGMDKIYPGQVQMSKIEFQSYKNEDYNSAITETKAQVESLFK